MWCIKKGDSFLSKNMNSEGKHKQTSLVYAKTKGLVFNSQQEADSFLCNLRQSGQKLKGWESYNIDGTQKEEVLTEVPDGYVCCKGLHFYDFELGQPVSISSYKGGYFETKQKAEAALEEIKNSKKISGWACVSLSDKERKEALSKVKGIPFHQIDCMSSQSFDSFVLNNKVHVILGGCSSTEVDADLENIEDILSGLEKKAEGYRKELEDLEKILCDDYHQIEFSELNEQDGFKAYYVLKMLLRHRRTLKDNLEKINALKPVIITVKETKAQFLKMQKRSYTPKQTSKLFTDGRVLSQVYDLFKNNESEKAVEFLKN